MSQYLILNAAWRWRRIDPRGRSTVALMGSTRFSPPCTSESCPTLEKEDEKEEKEENGIAWISRAAISQDLQESTSSFPVTA
jgi:hypothetical protein